MKVLAAGLVSAILMGAMPAAAGTVEFCIEGEFDLGARMQGWQPRGGEWSPAKWCVVTEDDSSRVRFFASGKSNPDLSGEWTVAFLPPDLVRIVNADSPPDIEFVGASSTGEALRHRRIDPRRLREELAENPDYRLGSNDGWTTVRYPGGGPEVRVRLVDGHLAALETTADIPLRGRVPVHWAWDWRDPTHPRLELSVEGVPLFRGRGRWRTIGDDDAGELWNPTPGADPVEVPGEYWPSRVDMRLEEIGNGAYLVNGVRTGFRHLVVDTPEGLVVADAPAGWVELHQIPPTDLVPGLGISGLSEQLIDFLRRALPDRRIEAVVLTHAHDDHAGGARAFAAEGARIFVPAEISAFLTDALGRASMPADRLSAGAREVQVIPVDEPVLVAERVRIMPMGKSPHVEASLGVLDSGTGTFFVSDVHVPGSDAPRPAEHRVRTECWFAAWATEALPDDVTVINSHSAIMTPVNRLADYLRSDRCVSAR